MNLQNLLATLERSGLVADEVIDKLRRRIASAPNRFDGEGMAKWLVSHGYITPMQAKRLVQQFQADEKSEVALSMDTGMAVDDDADPFADDAGVDAASATKSNITRGGAPSAPADPEDDPFGLAPLDEDEVVKPRKVEAKKEESKKAAPPKEAPPPKPQKPAKRDPFEEGDEQASPAPPSTPRPSPITSGPAWRDDEQPSAPAARGGKEKARSSRKSDDPFADGASSFEEEDTIGFGGEPPRPADAGPSRVQKSIWDSPVLLIGGGVLLLMIILAGALWMSLSSSDAMKPLTEAEQLYSGGDYDNAISKYNAFIKAFPDHKSIGLARVHGAASQLHVQAKSSSDWSKTYESARETLDRISKEEEFEQAHKDVGAIAPKIASGLVKEAEAKNDDKLLALSIEALALLDKYNIPLNVQPTEEIAQIRQSIESTRRTIERRTALSSAVAKIDAAVSAGSLPDAYKAQGELTKRYPDLFRDESLREAVKKIVAAERAGIKVNNEGRPPLTAEAASDAVQVAFVKSSAQASTAPPAEVVCALAGGAAYGFDAATGRALWRRFIGHDGRSYPQPAGKNSTDVIVTDSASNVVLRVNGATGKAVWRQSFEGTLAGPPTVLNDRVLLSSRDGRIDQISLEDGRLVRSVQMATPLTCGIAADPRGRVYYQPAAHSTLYVLSADSGECVDVLYLAHAPQSVTTAAMAVNRYLLVVENRGVRDSVLHVLLADETGKGLSPVEQVPLSGHLHTPMLVADRILVVATDSGAVYSFEISLPGGERALRELAKKPADTTSPALRYPAFASGRLWVASRELTRYSLQAAGGRMNGETVKLTGDTFLQPLQVNRDMMFAVRQKPGADSVIVASLSGADASVRWEAEIATPAVGAPIAAGDKVASINTSGGLYMIDPKGVSADSISSAQIGKADGDTGHLTGAKSVSGNGFAAMIDPANAKRVWVVNAGGDPRVVSWESPDIVAIAPAALKDGLLIACKTGQAFFVDMATGKKRAQPFQPRVTSPEAHAWSLVGSAGDNALIADAGHLYYLGVNDSPDPSLAALGTANLAAPLVAAPCAVGQSALAVDAQNRLLAFALPGLEATGSETLSAAPSWGPRAFHDRALVALQDGRLACHGSDGKQLWNIDLAADPLVGAAPLGADHVLIALKSGALVKLSAADGTEAGRKLSNEPAAAGPTIVGNKIVTAGFDGTLSILDSF